MKNIENNQEQMNEVTTLNSRQIKARFGKRHMANIINAKLNVGNIVAHNIAETIKVLSVNQYDDFTWAGTPAPHTEVVATILADKPIQKSFRLYQAGPRANKMVVPTKKDRPISVESVDSFILDLVTDNVFQAVR